MTESKEKKLKPDRSEIFDKKEPLYETRQAPTKKRPTGSSND